MIEMKCSIGFRGNWNPVMTWRLNSEDGAIVDDGVEMIIHRNVKFNITSTLKLMMRPVMKNPWRIVCKTHFISYIEEEESMDNKIPVYNYTWFSPYLNGRSFFV